jgi:hypothetical protein
MRHLKSFNEENEFNQVTYKDILDLVENDQVKLINIQKRDIINYINEMVELNSKRRGVDILNNPIETGRRKGLVEIGDSFVVVFEDNKPSVIIGENELCNPFEFGDVVICPGHDSITCYNKKTGEHQKSRIR